jgi:hypothetical protein
MDGSAKRRWFRRRGVIAGVAITAVVLACAAVLLGRGGTAPFGALRSGSGSTVAEPAHEAGQGKFLPGTTAGAPTPMSALGTQSSGGDSGTSSAASNDVNAALPPLDPTRFLVQTGDMTLYVAKGQVPVAAAKISALAGGLGGYVLQSNVVSGVDGQKPWAAITVRVPAQSFQTAIQRIGGLGQVKALQTGAQDVTGQYIDVRARLAHYRAVEQRLLTFLANAKSIEQALAIQQRIDHTQLTVEELAGQVKAMREQITYGTLSVNVTERPGKVVVTPTKHDTFIAAFVHSAKLLGSAARSLFVALGAAIPFIVLVALLGWLGWMAARRTGLLPQRRGSHSVELRS